MSSSAAASGSTVARVAARARCAVASASTGPDALAAGQQRVAHRLLEARRRRARAAKRSSRQVGLDLRAQVVGVASRAAARAHDRARAGRPRRARRRRRAPGGRARRRPRRRARAHSSTSAAARSGVELAGAQLGGGALEALDERRRAVGSAHARAPFSRTSRSAAPRMPLTKPGRLGAAERLGGLDGLVDRALGRDRRGRPRRGRGAASRAARRAGSPARAARCGRASSPSRGARCSASSSSALSAVACASARVKVAASRSKTSSSGRPVRSCW